MQTLIRYSFKYEYLPVSVYVASDEGEGGGGCRGRSCKIRKKWNQLPDPDCLITQDSDVVLILSLDLIFGVKFASLCYFSPSRVPYLPTYLFYL